MYAIYLELIQELGYSQEFTQAEIEADNNQLDELVGYIAQVEDIDNTNLLLAECDHVTKALEKLGYEV